MPSSKEKSSDRSRDKKHTEWAKKVKELGFFRCFICGESNTYLHSHHLYSYSAYENLRYDLSNGICICETDHNRFHQIYGKITTKEQFEQFVISYKLIKTALINKLSRDAIIIESI